MGDDSKQVCLGMTAMVAAVVPMREWVLAPCGAFSMIVGLGAEFRSGRERVETQTQMADEDK
jgi:hypothetical protein